MSLRETLNNNPALLTVGTIVLLIVCLGLIVWQVAGGGGQAGSDIDSTYYYDLNTGKVFSAPTGSVPPIDTDSGAGQGVQARVYSCGECAADYSGMTLDQVKSKSGFIAYLMKYPPDAKEALSLPPDQQTDQNQLNAEGLRYEQDSLVKTVDGDQWVLERNDGQSSGITDVYQHCPEGDRPTLCYPG